MKFINIQTDKFKKYNLLSVEDKASLLDCIVNYARNGVEPSDEVSVIVSVLFSQIQEDMEYFNTRYSKRCEKNKYNAQRRWSEMQSHPNAMQSEVKDKDKDKDKEEISFSDDTQMDKAIKKWIAYKKERGQTYKPMGIKSFITRLHGLSYGRGDIALQIVEQSISNNYSGVFPITNTRIEDNSGTGVVLQNSPNKDYSKGGW